MVAPRSQEPQTALIEDIVSISNTAETNSLPVKEWYTTIKIRQKSSKEVFSVSYLTRGVSRSAGSANADKRMHEDFPGEIEVSSFNTRLAKSSDEEMKTLFEVLPTKFEVVFNIKLGKDRFEKCFIIKAKNETQARVELQLRIKKEFTNIKSITNVRVKEATEESEEYSKEIIENLEQKEQLFTEKDLYKYRVAIGKLTSPNNNLAFLYHASKVTPDSKLKEELRKIIQSEDDFKNYTIDEIITAYMKDVVAVTSIPYKDITVGKPVSEAEAGLDRLYCSRNTASAIEHLTVTESNKDKDKDEKLDTLQILYPHIEETDSLTIIKPDRDSVPDKDHRYYRINLETDVINKRFKILTTNEASAVMSLIQYIKNNHLQKEFSKLNKVTVVDLRENDSIDIPINIIDESILQDI